MLEIEEITGRDNQIIREALSIDLRWSHIVGQLGGEVKVYSAA